LESGLPRVAVPETTVETVLAALVDNSRQAGAHTARISAQRDGRSVVLAVVDDGPGVPAADRQRLFEPFFTTRRADGGTGLGLPIARSLVEAHGGRINVVEVGIGARFEVVLPERLTDAAAS
jgi:signal transduction histidine kinase